MLVRMASIASNDAEHGEDNFELELNRVRELIKLKFVEIIDCCKARESALFIDLDKILYSYHSYRSELRKVDEERIALERSKLFHQNELKISSRKSVHEDCITRVNIELQSIENPVEPPTVTFMCYTKILLAEICKFGKLVEKINYKSKICPLVSVCKKGKETQQLNKPHGVLVAYKTGNIFVADQFNNLIKVFNNTGHYLYKFGNTKGESMNHPRGVAIYGQWRRSS